MFFNPFPHAIGIDINDLSIKMVQLNNISRRKRRSAFTLVNAKSTQLPHGLIVNGELEKPEAVRKYLLHLFEKRNRKDKIYKTPWAVASIPDKHGFIKLIQIDKEPGDIIDEDIIIASQKHVPFHENDYYLDWQIVPNHNTSNPEQTNILLASIPKSIANMYTYLLESVGFAVIALELGALSTARSMITANNNYEGQGRAILYLGATESTLTVYDHNHIQFSKSLKYSGELLTTSIAQNLHLSYDEAEMKKKAYGLEYTKSKCWPILVEQTDNLIAEIEQTLEFYYSHFPSTNKINHITMCGGATAMKGLDKILTKKLDIESQPGKVWKNLFSPKDIILDESKSLRFAKAIGLALRAASNPFFDNNSI
ncbi:MAG: pilus assembly protein PilM [bacterium]|nr:pilus assembly protein PilM [bacterium]